MVKIKQLSKTELKFIADMLDFASSEFSNNSCNDYIIPATDENKKMMIDLSNDMMGIDAEEEIERIIEEKDEILAMDWMLMKYLSKRCKALLGK